MLEIRLHGRFGQPVGALARSIGQTVLARGKHVQVFDGFAAFRPGAPTYSVVRIGNEVIRERSSNNTKPDVVIVLDNSLFKTVDVSKGLRENGRVMALGASGEDAAAKTGQGFKFVPLEDYFSQENGSVENGLLSAMEGEGLL